MKPMFISLMIFVDFGLTASYIVRVFESITVPLGAECVHLISKSLNPYCVGFLSVKSAIMTLPNPSLRHLKLRLTLCNSSCFESTVMGGSTDDTLEYSELLKSEFDLVELSAALDKPDPLLPSPTLIALPRQVTSRTTTIVHPITVPLTTSLFFFHFRRLMMI